jgi:hypothetical protein
MKLTEVLSKYGDPDYDPYDYSKFSDDELIEEITAVGTPIKKVLDVVGTVSKRVQLAAVEHWPNEINELIKYNEAPIDEDVKMAAVKTYGGAIVWIPNPSNELLKVALVDPTFINLRQATQNGIVSPYDSFVKEHFKNNSILMNKWLRYAQNIRDLG